MRKHTLLSFLFLFVFLSAFSTRSYFSLRNSIKNFTHFSKSKEVKENTSSSSPEQLVFEEIENDSEDSLNPSLTILPDYLKFDLFHTTPNTLFSELIFSEKFAESIFISIRTLRI